MAFNITDLTRHVAAGGDYPFGDIKDNPNGTLADRTMMTDLLQTMQKLMSLAGVTPNGTADNLSNGYQIIQALADFNTLSVDGGEWVIANNVAFVANNAPTGSYTSTTFIYNRYKIIGRTMFWQIRIDGTIAGSPTSFTIDAPSALSAIDVDWVNDSFQFVGMYNNTPTLLVALGGGTGKGQLTVRLEGGGAFTNASSQVMEINIAAEVFLNP